MKKKFIIAAVNAILVILVGICLIKIHGYSRTLLSQQAAEFWRGENESRFAQVAAYLPVGKETDENTIWSFRQTIDSRLRDDGVELPKEGGVWADAYSGTGNLSVTGSKGTYQATAVGVGGNFFLFHPYELVSGSFISDDDVMGDRVVLDYELAWKLFGGSDLAGMSVTIGGKPYYVAGVIKRESDVFSQKAFTGEPLIFMSYSAANENIGNFAINCYELVMPDPISNYVETFLTEGFQPGAAIVVQSTGRYGFGKIYELFKDFGARAIIDSGVIFPYWENAARVSEDYIARLYAVIAALGLFPFLCLLWLIIKLIRYIIGRIKHGWAQAKEAWDDRYARIDDMKQRSRSRKEKRGRKRRRDRKWKVTVSEDPSPLELLEISGGFDDNTVKFDIESIVREVMDEGGL